MKVNVGISDENRKKTAELLNQLLADTYLLYLKTQNFHWNVEGAMFAQLHLMFEEQYTELAGAVDKIAERIRALGFYAPGSFAQYSTLSSIKESTNVPADKEMIKQLMEDHESVIRNIRGSFSFIEEAKDQTTVDTLTERMESHEKNSWMLRSLLK